MLAEFNLNIICWLPEFTHFVKIHSILYFYFYFYLLFVFQFINFETTLFLLLTMSGHVLANSCVFEIFSFEKQTNDTRHTLN